MAGVPRLWLRAQHILGLWLKVQWRLGLVLRERQCLDLQLYWGCKNAGKRSVILLNNFSPGSYFIWVMASECGPSLSPSQLLGLRLGERQFALSSLNLAISFSFYFLRELCIYRISFHHTWSYTHRLVWWPVCQVVPSACCSQFTFDNQEIWFL